MVVTGAPSPKEIKANTSSPKQIKANTSSPKQNPTEILNNELAIAKQELKKSGLTLDEVPRCRAAIDNLLSLSKLLKHLKSDKIIKAAKETKNPNFLADILNNHLKTKTFNMSDPIDKIFEASLFNLSNQLKSIAKSKTNDTNLDKVYNEVFKIFNDEIRYLNEASNVPKHQLNILTDKGIIKTDHLQRSKYGIKQTEASIEMTKNILKGLPKEFDEECNTAMTTATTLLSKFKDVVSKENEKNGYNHDSFNSAYSAVMRANDILNIMKELDEKLIIVEDKKCNMALNDVKSLLQCLIRIAPLEDIKTADGLMTPIHEEFKSTLQTYNFAFGRYLSTVKSYHEKLRNGGPIKLA